MTAISDLGSLFSRFNKQFWVVNTFELFERGAYYGMMAIFSYHFIYNIGLMDEVVGLALGILTILLYFMPLVAATLAEKYGYKPAFIISFIIIVIGYFSLYSVNDVATLFVAIFALGVGAGAFKPMVSATIAHVTPHEDRNYGYSIYYWMINLGAFLFPLFIGFYIEGVLGDTGLYNLAFLISCVLIVVNLVICFVVFKDPKEPDRQKRISKAFADLAYILVTDKRFTVLLAIYSGFWFMFSLNHSFLPVYLVDFGYKPDWFAIPWIGIINPGTIIIAGPFLSKMVDRISGRFSSLQLMITGMSIFIIGLMFIAFGKSFLLAATGIVIFSFGEFLTHPNFISYVSKLAPKDKVAMYMGYAFIPIGIGYSAGSFASGFLYANFSVDLHKPTIFWSIVAATGIVTIAGFLIYNRVFFGDRAETAEERSARGVDASAPETRVPLGKVWTSKFTPLIALLLVPILMAAALSAPADPFYREEEEVEGGKVWVLGTNSAASISRTLDENQDMDIMVNVTDENVVNVTVTLTWTDEGDPGLGIGFRNQPDTFSLKVQTPDGIMEEAGPTANPYGGEGSITVEIKRDGTNRTKTDASGDYLITVSMGDAGDISTGIGPGLISLTDTGNDFTLEVEWDFYKKEDKPKEDGGEDGK